MSSGLAAGLGLALASAAALNWSYFVQHRAASGLPPLMLRRPLASLRLLFGHLRWLAGFLVGIGGWGLYVGALALAPLSLVQAASAGGIGLLAVLVSRGAKLTSRERRGVAVSVAGLVLLGASIAGQTGSGSGGTWLAVVAWIGVSVVAAGVAARPLSRVLSGGAGLGIAAGLCYAAGDIATKAAVPGGARLAFVPLLLACHGLAFVALQLGFQRGSVLATAGLASLLTNALPIAAGTTVFGEGLGSLPLLRVLAFLCTVLGATLLARPAREDRVASTPEPLPRAARPLPFD